LEMENNPEISILGNGLMECHLRMPH